MLSNFVTPMFVSFSYYNTEINYYSPDVVVELVDVVVVLVVVAKVSSNLTQFAVVPLVLA